MQLTIDNRAEKAEKLILQLEDMGYRFRPTKYGYAFTGPDERDIVVIYRTVDDVRLMGSEMLHELTRYRKEASLYLTQRGKTYSRICRDIAQGGRVAINEKI
jgi:hypothetical protein